MRIDPVKAGYDLDLLYSMQHTTAAQLTAWAPAAKPPFASLTMQPPQRSAAAKSISHDRTSTSNDYDLV